MRLLNAWLMDSTNDRLSDIPRGAATISVPGLRVPLQEVIRNLPGKITEHRVPALAGNLAFRLLLTLLPGLLALIWLLRAFDADGLVRGLLEGAQLVVPGPAGDAVEQQVEQAPRQQANGDLTFAAVVCGLTALGSLLLTCRAFMGALNDIHEVKDRRTTLRQHVLCFGMALAIVALLLAAVVLLTGADDIARRLGLPMGESGGSFGWSALAWIVAIAFTTAALALLYHFAPDTKSRFHGVEPGTYLAAAAWFAFTVLFSLYLNYLARPNDTYGPLAGVAMLILYLYGTAWIGLLGAEMNHLAERRAQR